MSTSLSIFDDIIAKYPRERRTAKRLAALISEAQRDPKTLTFEGVLDRVSPSSATALALMLADAERRGLVQRLFRVESPAGGGVGTYHSLAEVPAVVHDWRTDQEVEVAPGMIRIVYKIPPVEDVNAHAR
jgi:hypothetical protein